MFRKLLGLTLLLLSCAFVTKAQSTTAPTCGLTNDSTNHPPNSLTAVTVDGTTSFSWHDFATTTNYPDVGHTFVDNGYGSTPCTHKVLTNSNTLGEGRVHNYAISAAMDLGDCYILTLDPNAGLSNQYITGSPTADCPNGNFGTWGSTVLTSGQMPARSGHSEFVWDNKVVGKFWNVNGNILFFCTITGVGTTSCTNTHTFSEYSGSGCVFPDYSAINGNSYIDLICQNSAGGTMDVFTYQVNGCSSSCKSPVYTTTCTGTVPGSNQPGCIHKLAGPTIDNGILIQFNGNACGAESGNRLWAPPWSGTVQVECLTDHVDVMGDLSSNSVALYEDFQDNHNYCPGNSGFRPALTFLPLSGNPTGLICPSPVEFGWDISTRDYPTRAWGLFSVQGTQANIGNSEQCNATLQTGTGTSATIAASPTGAVRASNVVTITANAALSGSFTTGSFVWVTNVTDTSFNSTTNAFQITVTGSTTFTYANTGPNASSGSGTATLATINYADPTTGNWNLFANELILTRVDAANDFTKIWRLGFTHQRGKCSGDFYTDPRASISMDGKYVVYDTNARWGATGKGSLAEPTDVIVMGPLFSTALPSPPGALSVYSTAGPNLTQPYMAFPSWLASPTAGVTYNVYRTMSVNNTYTCPSSGTWPKIASGVSSLSLTDSSLGQGVWCYEITAVNGAGESAPDTPVAVVVPPQAIVF